MRRRRWLVGVVLLLCGMVTGFLALAAVAGAPVRGALAAVLAAGGVALVMTAGKATRRTAAGTAAQAEAEAFRRFLHEVDAEDVMRRHAERQFVDHGAYAIALGMVDRWAQVVRDLEDFGGDLPVQPWYAGVGTAGERGAEVVTVGSELERFTRAVAGSTVGAWVATQATYAGGAVAGHHGTGAGGDFGGGGGGGDFGGGGGSF